MKKIPAMISRIVVLLVLGIAFGSKKHKGGKKLCEALKCEACIGVDGKCNAEVNDAAKCGEKEKGKPPIWCGKFKDDKKAKGKEKEGKEKKEVTTQEPKKEVTKEPKKEAKEKPKRHAKASQKEVADAISDEGMDSWTKGYIAGAFIFGFTLRSLLDQKCSSPNKEGIKKPLLV